MLVWRVDRLEQVSLTAEFEKEDCKFLPKYVWQLGPQTVHKIICLLFIMTEQMRMN